MGDETSVASPGGAGSAAPKQSNEELLSQIFGGSNATSDAPNATPSTGGKQSINDILGLFGSGSTPAPAANTVPPSMAAMGGSAPSLFGATAASPATQPHVSAAAPASAAAQRQTGYLAYDSNSLKIMLKPQVSAQRPGIVLVTASFEATGTQPVQGVNFQAAVPRVCQITVDIGA